MSTGPARKRFRLLVALTWLLPAPAFAQVEEPPADTVDRWKVSAELSFTDQSGNRVLRLLTGGFNVAHLQRDRFELDASIRSRYGKAEGELVVLSHTGQLAFDFRPNSTWSPFLFFNGERDEFKRLDARLSSGAGAKYTLQRTGTNETSISLALLHAYERIAPPTPAEGEEPVVTKATSNHLARWSLRARTSHELREGVTLRHTTFYQPMWDGMADYLLTSDTGLRVLLTERLAISVEYQFKRDSRPPEGISSNDRLLTTGLIIDF